MRHALGLILLLLVPTVYASPVTWTVDAGFSDGGTLTGSFDYDADTSTYSSVVLITTGGDTTYFGGTYNPSLLSNGGGLHTAASSCGAGAPEGCTLDLSYQEFLTNAGGTVGFIIGIEANSFFDQERSISSGNLTAVPIPAAVWLFGSALAGLGWMRRRQTA